MDFDFKILSDVWSHGSKVNSSEDSVQVCGSMQTPLQGVTIPD